MKNFKLIYLAIIVFGLSSTMISCEPNNVDEDIYIEKKSDQDDHQGDKPRGPNT